MKSKNWPVLMAFSLCLLFSFTAGDRECRIPENKTGQPSIVNIVNFIRLLEPRNAEITENVLYQTVVSQVEMMKKYRLKGSFLLQYDVLMDPRYQQLLKSLPRRFD